MKIYQQHDIGACYPPLAPEEFGKLKEAAQGLGSKPPVILFENKILDGWHWYKACLEIGIETSFEQLPVSIDPYEFVVRRHNGRRHLSQTQKLLVAEKMAKLKHGSNQHRQKVDSSCELSTPMGRISKSIGIAESTLHKVRHARQKALPAVMEALEQEKIGPTTAYEISRLPQENQPTALTAAMDKAPRKVKKNGTTENPELVERKAFELSQMAIIDAPSLYPRDAELPVHSEQVHTDYIREAIEGLRKEEPEIGKMTRGQLFKRIHPYTQRIQTYGKFGGEQHVRGPIDPRFVEWAGQCFLKLRAREAIIERRDKSYKDFRRLPRGQSKTVHQPKLKRRTGDEFDRLFREVRRSIEKMLNPFPSQYEDRLKTAVEVIISEHFAEKRAAHAKRLGLQTNGATAPLK